MSKSYGLILKKKPKETPKQTLSSVFNDDSDDDKPTAVLSSTKPVSATLIRKKKQTELTHEKALAEDPTAFEYDEVYDDIVQERNQKVESQKKADKERKPKYIEALLKAAKRRELEHTAAEERKQMKERDAEMGQFADKEVFVTGAYRKQMEELEKYKEDEERKDMLQARMDVTKQNSTAGFYKHLLNDLARVKEEPKDNTESKETKEAGDDAKLDGKGAERKTDRKKESKKSEKSYRQRSKRSESSSSSDEEGEEPGKRGGHRQRSRSKSSKKEAAKETSAEKPQKKSIYSSDEDDNVPRRLLPQTGGGLEIVKKKRTETAMERYGRRFTPSPPPKVKDTSTTSRDNSKEEKGDGKKKDGSRRDRDSRSRHSGKDPSPSAAGDGRRKHRRSSRSPPSDGEEEAENNEKDKSEQKKKKNKETEESESDPNKNWRASVGIKKQTDEERLAIVKKLFARKNDEKSIDEYRKRYFERKAEGLIVPPT